MSDWPDITRQILKERDASRFYSSILFRETVGSTNEWVRELDEADFPEGTVCIAEEQTAGRGRRGRAWESPKGENIYFSLLLRPAFAPERASALTLVMGLSVAQAVRSLGGPLPSTGIKWPNDVVLNHRKICGILTEMKADIGKIHYVCIGTGINVNQTEFAEELRDKATSLKLENGGRDVDRGRLLASVLLHFQENYGKYCKAQDFSLLANDYNALLIGRGGQVRIEDPQRAYIATSRGIAADGALIVELADGTVQEIKSGEVSVRGLYGYV
ncbi:MAG: biotin--[acetyl-CoA-carboxylase] ligase [Lachnospiraceae bacterium]|nr:biotin--[acetyl-CoA-carboxylase] ligase [Lachnospiraceae bacterium]